MVQAFNNRKAIVLAIMLVLAITQGCQTLNGRKQAVTFITSGKNAPFTDFESIWLSKEYYINIRSTLSPYDSWKKYSQGRTSIDLTISDSSMLAWNYHEGVTLFPERIHGDTLFLKCPEAEDYSIYVVLESDSALRCFNCIRDSSITLLRATREVRTADGKTRFRGYPGYFENRYFGGLWKILDLELDTITKGSFDSLLEKPGLKNFSYYHVSFDFDPGSPFMDNILFFQLAGGKIRKVEALNYKISKDSIYLYDITGNYLEDSGASVFPDNESKGALLYILSREQ